MVAPPRGTREAEDVPLLPALAPPPSPRHGSASSKPMRTVAAVAVAAVTACLMASATLTARAAVRRSAAGRGEPRVGDGRRETASWSLSMQAAGPVDERLQGMEADQQPQEVDEPSLDRTQPAAADAQAATGSQPTDKTGLSGDALRQPEFIRALKGRFRHQIADIKKKWAPVEDEIAEVYDGLKDPDYNQAPNLDGGSPEDINRTSLQVAGFVAGMTLMGIGVDVYFSHWLNAGRKAWSIILLFSSYLLLIPGLTGVLFSFNIVVNAFGHRISLQPDKDHDSCTESTAGLVHLLHETGSAMGAALVVTYAMVVPVVKLVLIGVGEVLRSSPSRMKVQIARWCIMAVQVISKWAAPDMFAYILLVYLVQELQEKPTILTASRLDVGFSCFSIFCVCSTISSLGVALPELPPMEEDRAAAGATPTPVRQSLLSPAARSCLVLVAVVLAAVFVGLFQVGLCLPCMSLRIDDDKLYPPTGHIPRSMKPVIDALELPRLLRSDVSIWDCSLALVRSTGQGEVSSVFALFMLALFTVALTGMNMLVLVCAAVRLWRAEDPSVLAPCPFLAISKVLKKLSMLDVCTMGVYVISFCLAIYREDGIVVSTERGLTFLLASEVLHSVSYYAVSGYIKQAVPETNPVRAPLVDERHLEVEPQRASRPLVCCAVASPKMTITQKPSPTPQARDGTSPGMALMTPQASSPFDWPHPSSPPATCSPFFFPRSPANFEEAKEQSSSFAAWGHFLQAPPRAGAKLSACSPGEARETTR